MKTRSFVAIASFLVITSLVYCSLGVMPGWLSAFAKAQHRASQIPAQQVQPRAPQIPQAATPAQPVPQKATPIERRQPERIKRDELSKKLELRRQEIRAEKKERVKKQQEAVTQDDE